MKLEVKARRALPCRTDIFKINDKDADLEDFGEGVDHGRSSADAYCCGDMRFDAHLPTQAVLDKYGINADQYRQVCDTLEAECSPGACEWCN